MERQVWHAGFLESLEALASLETQRRACVGRSDGSFPPPIEVICQLFDDSGIDVLLEDGSVFSEATDGLLRQMSALAGTLNVDVAPELLLQTEEWRRLSHDAARVLQMVKLDLAE